MALTFPLQAIYRFESVFIYSHIQTTVTHENKEISNKVTKRESEKKSIFAMFIQTRYNLRYLCLDIAAGASFIISNKALSNWIHDSVYKVRHHVNATGHFFTWKPFKPFNCKISSGNFLTQRETKTKHTKKHMNE